jgi:hypothetical protein
MPRLDNVWFLSFVPEVPPDAFMFGRVAPAPAIFTFRFTRNQRLRKGVSSRASEAISLNWISFLGRHDALTPGSGFRRSSINKPSPRARTSSARMPLRLRASIFS